MLMEIAQEFENATSPAAMASALRAVFATQHPFDQTKEQFYAIGLNTRHVIRYIDLISMGTLNASLVHPREVFRQAVHQGVAAIALAHNHPSGALDPSDEDIAVTTKMIQAGDVLGINVVDHLIIDTKVKNYRSLRDDKPLLAWSRTP